MIENVSVETCKIEPGLYSSRITVLALQIYINQEETGWKRRLEAVAKFTTKNDMQRAADIWEPFNHIKASVWGDGIVCL